MGKFQVKAAGQGAVFNLLATNGQVVATSEVYNSKDSLRKGIASVQRNAPAAGVEDQTVPGFAKLPNPQFEVYADKVIVRGRNFAAGAWLPTHTATLALVK